ncbi:MAG: hypothetical protein Fur0037_01160 [Planctomycetota bacterium]
MSKPPRRSVIVPILIAGVLSLGVTLLRLYGELQQWDPRFFNREAGGFGLVGISFLVPVFGFWFGRRLAAAGRRPRHAGKAALICIVGTVVLAGILALVEKYVTDDSARTLVFAGGSVLTGLAALVAWPSAWVACAFYGVLARIPVILVQHEALARGWDVHYAKGPPKMPKEQVEFSLLVAQATLWPFAYTVLIGGIFAALGAATVRKSG